MVNHQNNLVKGSPIRQKLQISKSYAESSEFLPAQGLFVFKKKSVATTWKLDHYSLDYKKNMVHTRIYITDTKSITLPCSLARTGNHHYQNLEVFHS